MDELDQIKILINNGTSFDIIYNKINPLQAFIEANYSGTLKIINMNRLNLLIHDTLEKYNDKDPKQLNILRSQLQDNLLYITDNTSNESVFQLVTRIFKFIKFPRFYI